MARTFTPSQVLRLRLMTYFRNNESELKGDYDNFEEFYQEVILGLTDNIEILVKTLDM